MSKLRRYILIVISFVLVLVSGGSAFLLSRLRLPSSPFGGAMPVGVRAHGAPESAMRQMIASDDTYIHSLETIIHCGRVIFCGFLLFFLVVWVFFAFLLLLPSRGKPTEP